MQLRGELDCDPMLAFDADEARKIAAMMTMAPNSNEVDPALEKSAMEELGSIVICSFISAVADFADIQLIPTPPQLVTDAFDAIIDGFLAKQALVSDIALVFDTTFRRTHSKAEGTIILFPSLELRARVLTTKFPVGVSSVLMVDEQFMLESNSDSKFIRHLAILNTSSLRKR